MARTAAESIYLLNGTTLDELYVIQNQIIENVQKKAISVFLKNKNLSGNPRAGSVEVKRFANAAVAVYGTAATAGFGSKIRNGMVTINLNQEHEIIEDVEKTDLDAYGVPDLVRKRQANFEQSLIRFLDTEFFKEAYIAGTMFTPSGGADTTVKKIEELIMSIETVANDYVDGVDREDIHIVLSTAWRSAVRNELDELPQGHILADIGAIGMLHGCVIFDSNRLPKASLQVVDAFAMYTGAVAQPVLFEDMYVEKIPYTNKFGIELFFRWGVEAVTPDLVKYIGNVYVA